MRCTRRPAAIAALVFACACGGSPPPRPAPVQPNEPIPAPAPAPAEPEQAPSPRQHTSKLQNGLTLVVRETPAGGEAQVQLGFRVGAATAAPGLAELGARTVVVGTDASQGRSSLEQTLANLGGFVRVDLGAETTWLAMAVPAARWQEAQASLFAALDAPPLSRGQLERIREQVLQKHRDAVAAEPARAMARALLLGAADPAAYLAGLLDRDPSEIGLFLGRHFRPENATLVLAVPGDPEAVAAALARPTADGPQRWNPPALAPSSTARLLPSFAGGPAWTTETTGSPCRASIVLLRPPREAADAAWLLTLQACVTLDGTGGRLERFQQEHGVGYATWTAEIVTTADRSAVLLTADIAPADSEKIWRALELARRSVRDVPPTASELELATRRARLSAGLDRIDDLARTRAFADASGGDAKPTAIPRPGSPEFERIAAEFVELPAAFFVIGGEFGSGIEGVRRMRLFPEGIEQAPTQPVTAATPPTPWLDRASDALGGAGLLRRVVGWDCEAHLQTESAPTASEITSWRNDGTLRRTRELLGSKVETNLDKDAWFEKVGDARQALDARETALLRREYARHPVALLAAGCAGTLRFRAIAQRTVGDRDMMILQAESDRFDRLRIHMDTESHLIRVVEVWETLGDGSTIHIEDAWSDYRNVGGLRVPFRRVTSQDEGKNRVETVFTKWQPVLGGP